MGIIRLKVFLDLDLLAKDLVSGYQFKLPSTIQFPKVKTTGFPLFPKLQCIGIRDFSVLLCQPSANGLHVLICSVKETCKAVGVQDNAHLLVLEAH